MNKNIKIKVETPQIKESEFIIAKENLDEFIPAYIIICAVTCWRAQIASSQTPSSISKKDLQGCPSMKYTAKLYNNSLINLLLSAAAVQRTAFFDANEYSKVPQDKRKEFIQNRIKDASTGGKAKILSNRQITNYEDLLLHRKGLIAQMRGFIQADTLYNPESITRGYNISHLTTKQFALTMISQIESKFSIPPEEIRSSILRNAEINEGNDLENKTIEEVILALIHSIVHGWDYYLNSTEPERIIFEDGIIVSDDENNTVPMESEFTLERRKPSILSEMEIPNDQNAIDSFIKIGLTQQKEIIKENKSINSPKKRIKKAK